MEIQHLQQASIASVAQHIPNESQADGKPVMFQYFITKHFYKHARGFLCYYKRPAKKHSSISE